MNETENLQRLQKIADEPLLLADILGYDKVKHKIHGEWIKEMWTPGNSVLQAHRNSYKTTCRVIGIIWGLLIKWEARILIIRKSAEEAEKIVKEIMRQYERGDLSQLYYDIYGIEDPRDLNNWSERKGLSLITKKMVTKERNIESTGVGKYPTGAHYDLILPDDIITKLDRDSHAERENTKEYVKELPNIIDPKGIGIKYSGTPWHDDDAFAILPEPKRYPVTMKFIEDITKEKLEALREDINDESQFRANYYLEHVDSSERPFGNPQFTDPIEAQTMAYYDPAFGDKKTNDFSALTIGTIDEGNIIITAGYIWRTTLDKSYDTVQSYCIAHNVAVLVVEGNQAQVALAHELQRRGLVVEAIPQHKNKHFRIMHYAHKNWKIIKFCHGIDENYLKQVTGYIDPIVSAHDDAPDSLAGLVQRLTMQSRSVELGYYDL